MMYETIIENIKENWHFDGHLNEDQRDFMINILTGLNPKYCIETGFATGRSSVTILESAKPKKMISIDIDLDYMDARKFSEELQETYTNYKVIEVDSSILDDDHFFNENYEHGIDFAFVDGDHSYNGVIKDLNNIYKKLNVGGIILIDDYYSGPPNGCRLVTVNNGVDDFCKENNIIKESWNKKGKGFAIIKKIK